MNKKLIEPKVGMLWTVGNSLEINRINVIDTGAIYFNQLNDGLSDTAWIVAIHDWQNLIASGMYKLVNAEFVEAEIVDDLIEWEVGLTVDYPRFVGVLCYIRVFAKPNALLNEIKDKAKEQLMKEAYPVTIKRIS